MNIGEEFKKYAVKGYGISSTTVDKVIDYSIYNLTPNIIEERKMNAVSMDVFSRLMMDRIIFLGTAIDDYVANVVQAQLLFLQSTDAKRDITIYINSPGGSVYAGLGIYDTMHFVTPDVTTICTGLAASMGAVLLASGTDGKRSALKHSRIMIHQPLSGAQGQLTDMEIALRETQKVRDELYNILAKHTKKSFEQIHKDCDRDNWMSSTEAKDYGLIDEVLFREGK
ncbi:MAG: ATP-dependent Clp protease proteolytic subunit [Bacteroidota bacterium]|nr:ATP-dependent Clp protease proteolytic subunit [Bacteroidota bacterium]